MRRRTRTRRKKKKRRKKRKMMKKMKTNQALQYFLVCKPLRRVALVGE